MMEQMKKADQTCNTEVGSFSSLQCISSQSLSNSEISKLTEMVKTSDDDYLNDSYNKVKLFRKKINSKDTDDSLPFIHTNILVEESICDMDRPEIHSDILAEESICDMDRPEVDDGLPKYNDLDEILISNTYASILCADIGEELDHTMSNDEKLHSNSTSKNEISAHPIIKRKVFVKKNNNNVKNSYLLTTHDTITPRRNKKYRKLNTKIDKNIEDDDNKITLKKDDIKTSVYHIENSLTSYNKEDSFNDYTKSTTDILLSSINTSEILQTDKEGASSFIHDKSNHVLNGEKHEKNNFDYLPSKEKIFTEQNVSSETRIPQIPCNKSSPSFDFKITITPESSINSTKFLTQISNNLCNLIASNEQLNSLDIDENSSSMDLIHSSSVIDLTASSSQTKHEYFFPLSSSPSLLNDHTYLNCSTNNIDRTSLQKNLKINRRKYNIKDFNRKVGLFGEQNELVAESIEEFLLPVEEYHKEVDVKMSKQGKEVNVKMSKQDKEVDVKMSKQNKEIDVKMSKQNKEDDVKMSKQNMEDDVKMSKREKGCSITKKKKERKKNIEKQYIYISDLKESKSFTYNSAIPLSHLVQNILDDIFKYNGYPTSTYMYRLANLMNVSWRNVKDWFIARRMHNKQLGICSRNRPLESCPDCPTFRPDSSVSKMGHLSSRSHIDNVTARLIEEIPDVKDEYAFKEKMQEYSLNPKTNINPYKIQQNQLYFTFSKKVGKPNNFHDDRNNLRKKVRTNRKELHESKNALSQNLISSQQKCNFPEKEFDTNISHDLAKSIQITPISDDLCDLNEIILEKVCQLKENLSEKDSLLKENISDKECQLKENISDKDFQLKENISDKERQLKENISDKERQLKENISDKERQLKENISDKERQLKENISDKERQLKENISEKDSLLKENISDKDFQLKENISDKERQLKENISDKERHLKENISEKDSLLKENISDKERQLKENISDKDFQLKENISDKERQLKENISDKECQLKENISDKERHLKENISDKERQLKENISEKDSLLKENISDKECQLKENISEKDSLLKKNISDKERQLKENISDKEREFKKYISEKGSILKKYILDKERQLKENISEKDSLLKENISDKERQLKENISEKDSLLKENISDKECQLKENISDKEHQLKENISDKECQLKENISDKDSQLKENISDKERQLKENISDKECQLKENLSDKECQLKENVSNKKCHLKENIIEKDSHLKENISEKEHELKENISDKDSQLKENITEKECQLKENISEKECQLSENISEKEFKLKKNNITDVSCQGDCQNINKIRNEQDSSLKKEFKISTIHPHNLCIGYRCPTCEVIFQTEWLLIKHCLSHRNFTCSDCGEFFEQESLLKSHLKEHIMQSLKPEYVNMYICYMCYQLECTCPLPRVLFNKNIGNIIPQKAKRSKPFKNMPIPGVNDHLRVTLKELLQQTTRNMKNYNKNTFKKPFSPRLNGAKSCPEEPPKTYTNRVTFNCDLCEAYFFSFDELEEHKSVHKINSEDISNSSNDDDSNHSEILDGKKIEKKSIFCTYCHIGFSRENEVRSHLMNKCKIAPKKLKKLVQHSNLFKLAEKGQGKHFYISNKYLKGKAIIPNFIPDINTVECPDCNEEINENKIVVHKKICYSFKRSNNEINSIIRLGHPRGYRQSATYTMPQRGSTIKTINSIQSKELPIPSEKVKSKKVVRLRSNRKHLKETPLIINEKEIYICLMCNIPSYSKRSLRYHMKSRCQVFLLDFLTDQIDPNAYHKISRAELKDYYNQDRLKLLLDFEPVGSRVKCKFCCRLLFKAKVFEHLFRRCIINNDMKEVLKGEENFIMSLLKPLEKEINLTKFLEKSPEKVFYDCHLCDNKFLRPEAIIQHLHKFHKMKITKDLAEQWRLVELSQNKQRVLNDNLHKGKGKKSKLEVDNFSPNFQSHRNKPSDTNKKLPEEVFYDCHMCDNKFLQPDSIIQHLHKFHQMNITKDLAEQCLLVEKSQTKLIKNDERVHRLQSHHPLRRGEKANRGERKGTAKGFHNIYERVSEDNVYEGRHKKIKLEIDDNFVQDFNNLEECKNNLDTFSPSFRTKSEDNENFAREFSQPFLECKSNNSLSLPSKVNNFSSPDIHIKTENDTSPVTSTDTTLCEWNNSFAHEEEIDRKPILSSFSHDDECHLDSGDLLKEFNNLDSIIETVELKDESFVNIS